MSNNFEMSRKAGSGKRPEGRQRSQKRKTARRQTKKREAENSPKADKEAGSGK